MAIEITPKRAIKMPPWTIILGSVCLVLLIGLSASYFYFGTKIKKMSQEIQEKEKALVITPSEKALEDKLLLHKQKIDEFGKLLSEHKKPLNAFSFLEKICLPNVMFSDFSFTSKTREMSISGQTDSFYALEHQLFILKQEPVVRKLNISGVSISEEGEVSFSLGLGFNPQIFTPVK